MSLKELKKEIESLKKHMEIYQKQSSDKKTSKLQGIKLTVKAIDSAEFGCSSQTDTKLWWEIKKSLEDL